MGKSINIVWLRRNLRFSDNKPLSKSLKFDKKTLPIFIFDINILKRFSNPLDRRLSFLANILFDLHLKLKEVGSDILVLHGRPQEILPKLVSQLGIKTIFADQDFEPASIDRDKEVKNLLQGDAEFILDYDHLLFSPDRITKQSAEPFKVFTPYMKAFRQAIRATDLEEWHCNYQSKIAQVDYGLLSSIGLKVVNLSLGPEYILKQIGYIYQQDNLWYPLQAGRKLDEFINTKIASYQQNRDFLNTEGTSSISPYLRFGLISVRDCFRRALHLEGAGPYTWVNELIWREFYAMILYFFPATINLEFQEKYRGAIKWNQDYGLLTKFTQGQTGFPIIDAAVKQLLAIGWMHNRARMIVASFFTKNLLLDWRLGEEFFAQHLMDYELASNVGGWQWSSSCGTDAQPYFRVFNPFLQGQKFDPDGEYVRKYLPIFNGIDSKLIHDQKAVEANFNGRIDYPAPIIDYSSTRQLAINTFSEIKS